MGTPDSITVGSKVWVEDPEIGWIDGDVSEINGKKATIITSSERTVVADISSIYPKDTEAPPAGVDDMTKLRYLDEAGVLHNLGCRFSVNEIHTYAGKILIAVNPFQWLPHLYDIHMMEQYKGAAFGELSPHLFAVADTCYRAMINDNGSQSILVSGESGAGKTETTKMLMRYLAFVGGRSGTEGRSVEQQVLASNPVLEAFGNAKTVKNNNSSRFGKFVEIQYDKNGKISGAAIRTYLLERSRVCQVSDLERNFHCFYMLCAAPPEDAKKYKLGDPRQFHYLNQSNCYEVSSVDDAKVYLETRNAMDVVGISQEEQESISRVLAAILHLGNIDFIKGKEVDSSKLKDDKSLFHLRTAAELFMCDEKALEDSLCKRVIVTPNGNITKPLDPDAAVLSRDALAKTLYSRLFDWIVDKINSSIGQDSNAVSTIRVLDIHGFESSKINSFEQLCINLTSEKLQQHFNQHVLKMEQEEYIKEEINWSYVEFVDNQDVLDLIEKKPGGIISLLDEACMLPNSTHETFVQKLCQTHKGHKRFGKPKLDPTDFTINHYAGDVTYQADHFLDNNKDYVVAEHQALLFASKCLFVANLFPPLPEETSKQPKFSSIGSQLKQQLQSLMETLNTTEPCYIRCVKPNTVLQPRIFENLNVLRQLRCGGVLEAIRITCARYQTKRTFEEFLDRFGMLSPDVLDRSDEKKASIAICDKMGLKGYQMGKTKVFLRAGQEAELDARRAEVLAKAARHIQRQIRALLTRKEFTTLRNATIRIQKIWRAKLARKLYKHMRREAASIRIQKHVRADRARKNYKSLQASAQSGMRAVAAQNEYIRQMKASIKIQRQWRRVLALSGYKQERPTVIPRWKRALHWITGFVQRSPEISNNSRQMSKKAILIGCNYPGKVNELKGCINDVRRMKRCLMAYLGFSWLGITVLIDTDPYYTQPTANNILTELSLLVKSAKPGDVLFVFFSGHGDRQHSKNKDDDTGYDEYIVATDEKRITDDDFRAIVALVPEGCRMTIVADCCHSGGLIEGAKEQIGNSTKIRRQHSRSGSESESENFHSELYAHVMDKTLAPSNPSDLITGDDAGFEVLELGESSGISGDQVEDDAGFELLEFGECSGTSGNLVEVDAASTESSNFLDRGILLSACQSDQIAKEASFRAHPNMFFGVFTSAIVTVIRVTGGQVTNWLLVSRVLQILKRHRFTQRPGLYCSDCHAHASFLGADSI